jgi:N utilization substance protein B
MALQVLFQLDYNCSEVEEALEAVLAEHEVNNANSAGYARKLVFGAQEHKSEIDQVIAGISNEWKIERMAGVDRNIVRLAIFEMQYSEEHLSPNIIINEAVELGKVFGTEESGRFINGILGSLVKNGHGK